MHQVSHSSVTSVTGVCSVLTPLSNWSEFRTWAAISDTWWARGGLRNSWSPGLPHLQVPGGLGRSPGVPARMCACIVYQALEVLMRDEQASDCPINIADDGQLAGQDCPHNGYLHFDGTTPPARNSCEGDAFGRKLFWSARGRRQRLQFSNEGVNVQFVKASLHSGLMTDFEIAARS